VVLATALITPEFRELTHLLLAAFGERPFLDLGATEREVKYIPERGAPVIAAGVGVLIPRGSSCRRLWNLVLVIGLSSFVIENMRRAGVPPGRQRASS